MGVAKSTDILQQNMNDLFHGFKLIYVYIYEPLILTKGDWKDYVQKIYLSLNKLKEKNFNVILKMLS